ncbi:MAG TPA: hypothetical protein VII06_33300 [Chloroflexota bacterium]|jgi:hypothetical protein
MAARAGIFVRLGDSGYDALCVVAAKEWRDPEAQAAKFVWEGLERAGALPSTAGLATAGSEVSHASAH